MTKQSDHIDLFAAAHDAGVNLTHAEAAVLLTIRKVAESVGIDIRDARRDARIIASCIALDHDPSERGISPQAVELLIRKGGF